MGRHPHHDAVAAEVARWYRQSTPEMGYDLAEGRYGWFHRPGSTGRGRGTVRPGVRVDDVDALIAEADEIVGGGSLSLELDDRATATTIGPALEARGFEPGPATVFLAHLPPPGALDGAGPEGLAIDSVPVEGDALRTWATVKLQSFADSEGAPEAADLDAELVQRRAEMAGMGRSLLARVDGEAAAICGYYDGPDRFVFVLGTRVPFRHRGIGHALLGHVVREATAAGARSVLINAGEGGLPEALYRRLGFTDEVHWRRSWTRKGSGDGSPTAQA